MKIRIVEEFIGNVNGKSVYFIPGRVVDVDEETADNFVRGRYAEYLTEPAIKIVEKPKHVKGVKVS